MYKFKEVEPGFASSVLSKISFIESSELTLVGYATENNRFKSDKKNFVV
jgi:hypothetical protein